MLRAITRYSSGNNLPAFCCEVAQASCVFVVNNQAAVSTKPTDFSSVKASFPSSFSIECHFRPLLYSFQRYLERGPVPLRSPDPFFVLQLPWLPSKPQGRPGH